MFKNMNSKKTIGLLVALVLITACFIGGTIARYVTSTSSEDQARVAVWGINEVGPTTMDLFNNVYTLPDGTEIAKSSGGVNDKIIAPGTSNDHQFKIVNTDDTLAPEVMYEIRINLDDSEINPLILNNPSIQWRLDGGAYGTWEETKAKILLLSGDASGVKTYAPGTMEHEFANGKTHTIGWTWVMDNNNDEMDTDLGNAAIDGNITAKIAINITARQVNTNTTGLLDGDGSIFNINNPTPLTFRSAAPTDELVSVEVNGDELTQGTDYTVASGSTVITLKESYLADLEIGNYTISIISEDITTKATFSVAKIGEAPIPTDPFIHNGIIPEGGIYYKGVTPQEHSSGMKLLSPKNYANGTAYTPGQEFPEPQTGDVYVYGDYEYRYNMKGHLSIGGPAWTNDETLNGWGVYYISNNTEASLLLNEINNKKIVNMEYTFAYNNTLIKAPSTLPDTVSSMDNTFAFCSALTTPPTKFPRDLVTMNETFTCCTSLKAKDVMTIPSNVKEMEETFNECESLQAYMIFECSPTIYYDIFRDTKSITIAGFPDNLNILKTIANEYNNVTAVLYD